MFSTESIIQSLSGSVGFGNRVTSTISRNGDLLHRLWVVATITDATATATGGNVGHRLLKTVELEIGGQRIDKHYSDWLQIWSELTMPAEKKTAYDALVGTAAVSGSTPFAAGRTYYVPLQFWFCRNVGLALPLIALQYHEVKVNIEFASVAELLTGTVGGASLDAQLWADYIYLDVDERKRFAQVSHEYLIDQLQFVGSDTVGAASGTVNSKLNFNHPVKELVWVMRDATQIATTNITSV
jgi:hypothetical protein